jgi:OFA family oxalate/formate antiporter-like MFS transporter
MMDLANIPVLTRQLSMLELPEMTKRAGTVLFACFCTVFAAYAIRYSYGTLLPEMLPSLSITKAQAGVIYSSYFIAYTLLSPVLGLLSDRFDIRIMLSVFVALMGGGAFLMQYAGSVLQASLFFTLAGIGCAACWAPVMAIAQRWTSDKRRGLSLALVDAGSTLGVMAAGALVPLVVVSSGWRLGWMSLGILGLVLGVMDFFLIRASPTPRFTTFHGPTSGQGKLSGFSYRDLFRDKRFWFISLAYLLTGFAIMVPFTFLSTYAVQELAFSYDSAAMLVTVIGIGGLAGKLTLGPLSDRLGRIIIMLLCAVLIAGGCLGIVFSHGWTLILWTAVFGVGYGACWSMYAACAGDFFSKQAAGGIIGIWTFYLGLGLLSSPVVAGWLADITGSLTWSFIMAAAAGAISLFFLLPMLKSR